MGRTINTERTAERILALQRTARRGGEVRLELEPIIDGLRRDLDETMSKSQAAKVIGVSVPTLDKWIAQRIVPVERAVSGRPRSLETPHSTSLSVSPTFASAGGSGTSSLLSFTNSSGTTPPTSASSRSSTALGSGRRGATHLYPAAPTAGFGPED